MGLKTKILFALMLGLLPHIAQAECSATTHDGNGYVICEVQASEDLRLFHSTPEGSLLGSFTAVNDALNAEARTLGFAMNAGMYHPDRRPVGLMIMDGVQIAPIVTRAGPGNFGLLPNGVFCIGDTLSIRDARAFAANPPACRYATQSGPMLVIDGVLHPRFLPDSDSAYIRNGVGVSADGRRAAFAVSDGPVTFHQFARLFRDGLSLPNALYLDGSVSRLYAPGLDRHDGGFPMGPIIGTATPKP